jgi:hypothetical protein
MLKKVNTQEMLKLESHGDMVNIHEDNPMPAFLYLKNPRTPAYKLDNKTANYQEEP